MQPASQTTDLNALLPKTNIYLALQASPSWTSENGDCFIPYEEQCKVTSLIISFNFFAQIPNCHHVIVQISWTSVVVWVLLIISTLVLGAKEVQLDYDCDLLKLRKVK